VFYKLNEDDRDDSRCDPASQRGGRTLCTGYYNISCEVNRSATGESRCAEHTVGTPAEI
jgi:hypothetical protein